LAVWQPLQPQAGQRLALAQEQQVEVKAAALLRLSVQLQPEAAKPVAVKEQLAGVQAEEVQPMAGKVLARVTVPQPQQAALRVRAKQAQQFRVVFVLAGLAFSRLVRWPPVCLLQAYSPHAVLVPAQLFEPVAGWRRPLGWRRQVLAMQTPQQPRPARCLRSIAMAQTDPVAGGSATAWIATANLPGAATPPATATGLASAFASEAMDRMAA
jgi:hypothetical protein